MSKKILFIVAGIILVISGAVLYAVLTPRESPVVETEKPAQSNPSSNESAKPKGVSKGEYLDYSEEALAAASGTKLLFFYAPWCPQCREVEASIKDAGLPDGVAVFKVDYDSNQELRQKYGVTIQTTFVKVDDNGNKIASYVAYDEPRFSSVERELLP